MDETDNKVYVELMDLNLHQWEKWSKERKPFSVLFELTARCNMNCIHCYLQNVHTSNELSYNQVTEIIDILYENGILFLTLTGGEIFTRQDFLDIYLYAKKKGFLVELFSNGYMITDKVINVLRKYPPLFIDISLYGACEETYFRITGVKGAFSKVLENIIKLKNAGIHISLRSPILKYTENEISSMKNIAESIDVPFVCTFEICPTVDRSYVPKQYSASFSSALMYEFNNYYEQVQRGNREDKAISELIIEKFKNSFVFACNVALNSFVIDYRGRMCPCMKLKHKGIQLSKNNYAEIWKNFRKFSQMKASDHYKCSRCDARYYCDICPAEMDLLYGDMEYRPDSVCVYAKMRKDFYEKHLTYKETMEKAALFD